MTIFSNQLCYVGYTPVAVCERLSTCLLSGAEAIGTKSGFGILTRLECFLQVTGQTLSIDEMDDESGINKIREFAAAMYSETFDPKFSTPFNLVGILRRILRGMAFTRAFNDFVIPTDRRMTLSPELAFHLKRFEARDLVSERCRFWSGWSVTNKLGVQVNLRFHRLFDRFGPDFASSLHKACADWSKSRRSVSLQPINDLAQYLCSIPELSVKDFRHQARVSEIIQGFFEHFFVSRHEGGIRTRSSVQAWSRTAALLTDHVLGSIWAKPNKAIPVPPKKASSGRETNVRKSAAGVLVKHSLLTDIPLHISDSAAKDLLFGSIRQDLGTIVAWARAEIELARKRLQRRKELAPLGQVVEATPIGVNTGINYRLSRECPDWLSHASATFESRGIMASRFPQPSTNGPAYARPLAETTWDLGLPTPRLLLAHATVLVKEHPEITTSFLENLSLFNKNGKQIGVTTTDAGTYLVGAKYRKGPAKAQQKILLNVETKHVIDDVIELTRPLRDWLKKHRRKEWRLLFLSLASLGTPPTAWRPSAAATKGRDWLAARIEALAGAEPSDASRLASCFSLKKVRSSAAVVIYIETESVQKMAESLGHTRWEPSLLDHYLPEPIQSFFVERWIRLFQEGIICEALKDSPLLLAASSFESMAELDEFLENHAIRMIPDHLKDPDWESSSPTGRPVDRLVFGVDVNILICLLDLREAVSLAHRNVCGRAIRWASIAGKLVSHLETQSDQPELRKMLQEARRLADGSRAKELIYG